MSSVNINFYLGAAGAVPAAAGAAPAAPGLAAAVPVAPPVAPKAPSAVPPFPVEWRRQLDDAINMCHDHHAEAKASANECRQIANNCKVAAKNLSSTTMKSAAKAVGATAKVAAQVKAAQYLADDLHASCHRAQQAHRELEISSSQHAENARRYAQQSSIASHIARACEKEVKAVTDSYKLQRDFAEPPIPLAEAAEPEAELNAGGGVAGAVEPEAELNAVAGGDEPLNGWRSPASDTSENLEPPGEDEIRDRSRSR